MGVISPSQSNPGGEITASAINTPVNQIAAEFNGNIDNANIKSGAAIDGSKLADDSVTAGKVVGLDKSNLTTDYNPYKFRAYRSAAQNVGTTFTKVVYDTEVFDTNNNFATGTYTAPVAGFYWFSVTHLVTTAGSGTFVQVHLYKNGSVDTLIAQTIGAVGGNWGSSNGTLIQLAANDTIEVYIGTGFAAKALDVSSAGYNVFSGFLVSRT
jgi:hypothetical protein